MFLIITTTHNTHFGVATADKEKILSKKIVQEEFKQSELLLFEVEKILNGEIPQGIIVSVGPGGFSSVRIGVATANALAFGWNVPVVGVEVDKTLEAEEELQSVFELGINGMKIAKKGDWAMPVYDKGPNITKKRVY